MTWLSSRHLCLLGLLVSATLLGSCGDSSPAGKDLAARASGDFGLNSSSGSLSSRSLSVESEVSEDTGRKLVYTARMVVHVDEYAGPAESLRALVKEAKGYVVDVREWHDEGRPGAGDWTLRVPAQGLDSFLERVATFGAVQSRSLESEDVTASWVDLERRAEIARRIEARYIELLKTTKTDLEQTLALEEKLIRARAQIEALEGQRRELGEVVRYATINLELRSLRRGEGESLALGDEAGAAWGRSIQGLRVFGRALIVGAVAAVPWLLILLPFALLAIGYVRRRRRAR